MNETYEYNCLFVSIFFILLQNEEDELLNLYDRSNTSSILSPLECNCRILLWKMLKIQRSTRPSLTNRNNKYQHPKFFSLFMKNTGTNTLHEKEKKIICYFVTM